MIKQNSVESQTLDCSCEVHMVPYAYNELILILPVLLILEYWDVKIIGNNVPQVFCYSQI